MQHEQTPGWNRIAGWIAANRGWVIFGWLLLLAISIPLAVMLQDRLTPTRSIAGTESAYVDQLIADRFGRDSRHSAVLVIAGLQPVGNRDDKTILKAAVAEVRSWPQVVRASSIIDVPRGLMVGQDGTGAIITVQLEPGTEARSLKAPLGRLADEIAKQGAGSGRALKLHWTGNFFVHSDVRQSSERGARQGEMVSLPLTLLLLYAVFGSLRAALSPVLSAIVAVAVSIGVAGAIAIAVPWNPSVLMQNVVSLIGLALTIDYSLLTVNRFRRATEHGMEPQQAIVAAAASSAPTIVLAGSAVLLGFAALLVVPIEEIRAIGVGGVLASILAVCVSTTLLPTILGLLAPRLARDRGPAGGARYRAFFAALATAVCRRPIAVVLVSTLPLVLLALPVRDLQVTAHSESWLPSDMPSTKGIEALVEMGRRGLANEILVVAEMPEGESFLSAQGWDTAHEIYQRLAVLDGIESVLALPRWMSAKLKPETLQNIPRKTLDPFLSGDNRTMLFRIIPDSTLDYEGMERVVKRIRAIDRSEPLAAKTAVGGLPASTVDYVAIVELWMPYVVGLVIMGAFLVLAVSFGGLIVAAKAVVLNLLSVAAAFGLATLVFIDGYGAWLIGVSGPVDGVFPAMPLIVFCAVFGVSMDYEVFLISRVVKTRAEEKDETQAIIRGISETGMVITFAAAIMILVFGSFTAGGFLPAKMLGFTLAVAVLIDATIVRILLSPALMRLAGRWNWWPGG